MFSQCTIQKRVHQKGWYVSFRKPIHASTNTAKSKQTRELVGVDSIQAIAPDSPDLVRQTSVPSLFQDSIVEPQVEMLPVGEPLDQMLPIVTDTLKKGSQHKQPIDPEKEPNLKRQQAVKTIVILVFVLLMLTILIVAFISVSTTGTILELFGFVFGLFLIVLLLLIIAISGLKRKENQAERAEQKSTEIRRKPTEEELVQLKKEKKKQAILLTVLISILTGFLVLFIFPIADITFLIFCLILYPLLLVVVWSFAWRKQEPVEITVTEEPEVIVAPEKPVLTEKEKRRKNLKGIIFFSIFGIAAVIIGFLISSD